MKERTSKILSRIISVVFGLSAFVLVTLLNNRVEGAWYLYAMAGAYVMVFAAVVSYIVLFFAGAKKTDSWGLLIIYLLSIPVFLFGANAVDCCKDLFGGSTVCVTDVYKVPVAEYYEDIPYVHFSCEGKYRSLYISEEMYAILSANPYNENEEAIDEALNEKTHPHIYAVEIEFYPNTDILCGIRMMKE